MPSAADEPTRVGTPHVSASQAPSATRLDSDDARIEGYQLRAEIHRGGQGVVYRALQLGTKREVALKVLLEGPFASESVRRRFEREVELAASLRHPNIVTILDSGISHGRYYFAMEYIDGLRLDRYLAKMRPTMRNTLRLFETVCAAVNFAHQRGVIHRDLKPPNILVDEDGQPHILDFGLAKPIRPGDRDRTVMQTLSTAGQLLGTVAYMSPEQTRGAQDVDVRSDVYSLGVVYYEALLGQLPYSVEGPLGEVLSRIATAEPERPHIARTHSRFGRLVDDELETILLKALEKDPGRRYQTAGDLGRDLRHMLAGEPIEAKRASGLYMFRKTLRRYRLQAAAAAIILLTMVAFLVAFAFLWTSERDARERALRHQNEAVTKAIEARLAAEATERARQDLEDALVRQTIQRGELSQARGDLIAARDSFWDAYQKSGSPATLWALRQYYLQTGDDGATPLYFGSPGVVALSPGGRLAAVSGPADAITVRRLSDGHTLAWRHAPGPVTVLNLGDAGDVCAAGPGWARLWHVDSLVPAIAVELAADFRVRSVHAVADGQRLLLLGQQRLACFEGPGGVATDSTDLAAASAGAPDYAPPLRQFAVPTDRGVELFHITDEGKIRGERIGPPDVPIRAVRFAGDELLAVSDDAVLFTSLTPGASRTWRRWCDTPADWQHFDLHHDSAVLAFALPEGQVQLFRDQRLEHLWHVTPESLQDLRLTADGRGVVTVDRRGTATRWIPPERRQNVRSVFPQAPTAWTIAEDGSSILLADDQQRVVAYTPDQSPELRTIARRRPFRLPLGPTDTFLAASRKAARTVTCNGNSIRVYERGNPTVPVRFSFSWDDPRATTLKDVAITGDGRLVAFCAETPAGDLQQVSIHRWMLANARIGVAVSTLLPTLREPFDFVGSVIREMAFVPGTSRLLIARSSGELLLLDVEGDADAAPAAGNPPTARGPRSWVRLESPPATLAFARDGRRLAVACEDGVIRVLPVSGTDPVTRIRIGRPVRMLAFGPRGDVLMVCTVDGAVSLYELASAERVAQLRPAGTSQDAFATWIGSADTLLLSADGAVFEHPYHETDDLIARNRAYAREQAVARHLADGQFMPAWEAAAELHEIDPALARDVQETVLAAALQRVGLDIPPNWADAVLADPSAATLLRLGHAAYDGERFELAAAWLRRGYAAADSAVDAYTALRVAQCDYLLGDYSRAADEFAAVLTRPDLDAAHLPTVQLQQTAALVLAGDSDAAESIARRIGSLRPDSPRVNNVAGNSARDIARYLTDLESESLLVASVEMFVGTFATEGSLAFQDDAHFFRAERARQRGDLEQAAAQYQRCIDLARDTWPANWSHFRLAQLPNATPEATVRP